MVILMPDERQWRLAVLRGGQVEWHPISESEAAQKARALGAGRIGVALPACWCLTATIPTADLPRSGRRQAMLYALEEQLPLPVEDLVVQFITGSDWAMGAAVSVGRIKPLIEKLESDGLTVKAVLPGAIAAAGQLAGIVEDGVLLLGGSGGVELLWIDKGRARSWRTAAADSPTLTQALGVMIASAGPIGRVQSSGLTAALRQSLSASIGMAIADLGARDGDELAAIAAAAAVDRPRSATVDFLPAIRSMDRPARSRAEIFWLTAAGLALALSAPAALLWRAAQYDAIYNDNKQVQDAYYEARFNKQPPAAGIARIFAGELEAAKSGKSMEVVGRYDSAMRLIGQALSLLPETARVRIRSMRATTDRLTILAQAATRNDAYAAEKALAALSGFGVEITDIQDAGSEDGVLNFTLVISGKPVALSADRGGQP